MGSNPTLSAIHVPIIPGRSTQVGSRGRFAKPLGRVTGAWVRIPSSPPFQRGIAQLVEQWSPKPRAEGSNPSAPANETLKPLRIQASAVF